MQNLSEQLTAQKCSVHQLPLERICIEINCKHPTRGMCRKCPRTNIQNEANIYNIFEFIDEQSNQKDIQITQGLLFQQFVRLKGTIVKLLDELEVQMEELINRISKNVRIQFESKFIDRPLTSEDTETIGELLSQTMQITTNGDLEFKEVKLFTEYQEANIIIQRLKGSIDKLCGEYLTDEQQQQLLQKSMILSSQNVRDYTLLQTYQIGNCCQWMCPNHDGTQFAVVAQTSLIIFGYTVTGLTVIEQVEWTGNVLAQFVCSNHNTTQLATCGQNWIVIWNKQENGKWGIQDKICNNSIVQSLCYSHDSTQLAAACSDNIIQIYVIITDKWTIQQQLIGHTSPVFDVCFNNNSTLLASGSQDKQIILWKQDNSGIWIINQKLTEHTNGILTLAFNSDSTMLVSGSSDHTVRIWSADQGVWKLKHTLVGHTGQIYNVKFNKQSTMITSSSLDTTLKVWRTKEANHWECTQTIRSHKHYVLCSIINNDSSVIVSTSSDKTIQMHRQLQQ